jgi:hypothetical protein
VSLAAELYCRLASDAGVAALAGGRIYPLRLAQNTLLPAITYSRTGGRRHGSHDGPATLESARYRLNCWAETYLGAEALAEAVTAALDGRRWGSVSIVEGQADGGDTESGYYRRVVDAEAGIYRRAVEVTIWRSG